MLPEARLREAEGLKNFAGSNVERLAVEGAGLQDASKPGVTCSGHLLLSDGRRHLEPCEVSCFLGRY